LEDRLWEFCKIEVCIHGGKRLTRGNTFLSREEWENNANNSNKPRV
jgi:hypothetical protein